MVQPAREVVFQPEIRRIDEGSEDEFGALSFVTRYVSSRTNTLQDLLQFDMNKQPYAFTS